MTEMKQNFWTLPIDDVIHQLKTSNEGLTNLY